MRIWHAGAALNAGLTACGNATGPKDIFGSSAVPRFIIPPARLQCAHTHTVFGSVSIKVRTAIAHATVQACMPARNAAMRVHAYPNPLFAPTVAGIAPGVGSPQIIRFTIRWGPRDRGNVPQSAGEVARGSGFCFFTVCTACMHFWRRQRKRPWAATGAVRRKVIFKSSSATEQWGLGVGLGRVQFGGKCAW